MKTIADIIASRPTFNEAETKKALEEYEDLINRAAKITKIPYIATHKRIEKAFDGVPFENVMSWLRMAVSRAEKEEEWPKSKMFNYLLKKINEQRAITKMHNVSE